MKPLSILRRLGVQGPVYNLCDVVATATPASGSDVEMEFRDGSQVTLSFDARNKYGVPDDMRTEAAFAVAFTLLGALCCSSGRRYRLIGDDGVELTLGLAAVPQADSDPRESPESDLEYLRRRTPTYYEARPDKMAENVVPTLNLGASK